MRIGAGVTTVLLFATLDARPAGAPPLPPPILVVVDSTVDEPKDPQATDCISTPSGICTLRAAVQYANSDPGPAVDIRLPKGTYKLTHVGAGEDVGETGDLDLTFGTVTVAALAQAKVVIDGKKADRIFEIHPGVTATLQGLTLTHGSADTDPGGGAVLNHGTLTIDGVTITGNNAKHGGGVMTTGGGTLTVEGSHVTKNTAVGFGGGIYADGHNGGAVTISTSTIDKNTSLEGGGIAIIGSVTSFTPMISQVTISGNHAGYGGGLAVQGGDPGVAIHAYVTNTTVSGNRGVAKVGGGGAGILVNGAAGTTATLQNVTIVANAYTVKGLPTVGGGILISGGLTVTGTNVLLSKNHPNNCTDAIEPILDHSLDSDGSCRIGGPTNPHIGGLSNNGGPTKTYALKANSPAIDAGQDTGCPNVDQRGSPRPAGAHCDIGAFEFQPQ